MHFWSKKLRGVKSLIIPWGRERMQKNDSGKKLEQMILPQNFVPLCSEARENPMRDANYEIYETLSCLDDLSKCASMHVVIRFIAIVRFPMLFESSHCSKSKFSKTINLF